jgi:hypothetical protein
MPRIEEWGRATRQIITVALAEGATREEIDEALAQSGRLPLDDHIRDGQGRVIGTVVYEDREEDAWQAEPASSALG